MFRKFLSFFIYWKLSFGYSVLFIVYETACDLPLLFGDSIEQFFWGGGGRQVAKNRKVLQKTSALKKKIK